MMMTYQEFRESYVEPTKLDYLKSFLELPTWQDARFNAMIFDQGPMSESEFENHIQLIGIGEREHDEKEANNSNRLRCRTTVGWYIAGWLRYFARPFGSTFDKYKEVCYENAYNDWSYSREEF